MKLTVQIWRKKYSEIDMLDTIQVDRGGQCDINRERMSYRRTSKRGKWKWLSPVQLFVTPWTVAHQAPQPMEFSRQEYWNGLPCPSPGDLPNPRIKPMSPALQADALPFKLPRKPLVKEKRDAYCVTLEMMERIANFILRDKGNCWSFLSKITWSDLVFQRVTLALGWTIDCQGHKGQSWKFC